MLRFSDFHIELEKLSEELKDSQYIRFTINLEQCLAVGSYSNVLQATKNSPFQYFNVFLERILETLRYFIVNIKERIDLKSLEVLKKLTLVFP